MIKHDKLFVCGAFCKGMVHFGKIESFILDVEVASVRGTVLRTPVGYPAMLSEGNDLIKGDLLTLKPSEVLLALLDEFHGFSPFQADKNLNFKESIEATLESGEVVGAHRYVLNPQRIPKNTKVIEGGDWKADLISSPPLSDGLTEVQAIYVKKLGTSKGRDIVPINIDLYRQLMSLELIVDKGRRLALSKLGKEVFKYLTHEN